MIGIFPPTLVLFILPHKGEVLQGSRILQPRNWASKKTLFLSYGVWYGWWYVDTWIRIFVVSYLCKAFMEDHFKCFHCKICKSESKELKHLMPWKWEVGHIAWVTKQCFLWWRVYIIGMMAVNREVVRENEGWRPR